MTKILGASWKTSLSGIAGLVAAVGAGLTLLAHGNYNFSGPEWLAIYAAVSAAAGNLSARDNKVTSEQAKGE